MEAVLSAAIGDGLSTCIPSTNSTSIPGVPDSSIVTTPSGPTRCNARETALPIRSSSLAAIVATWVRSSRSS